MTGSRILPATLLSEVLGQPIKAERIDPKIAAAGAGAGAPALEKMFGWYDKQGLLGSAVSLRALLGGDIQLYTRSVWRRLTPTRLSLDVPPTWGRQIPYQIVDRPQAGSQKVQHQLRGSLMHHAAKSESRDDVVSPRRIVDLCLTGGIGQSRTCQSARRRSGGAIFGR